MHPFFFFASSVVKVKLASHTNVLLPPSLPLKVLTVPIGLAGVSNLVVLATLAGESIWVSLCWFLYHSLLGM